MANYIARDGCHIHYETFGTSGPLLALIPGLGGDGRFWNGVVALLASDYRLVVPDHRGAGRSQRPNASYSIALIAEDIAGILSQFDEPAHIVGHSTGGAIAQELALDHAQLGLSYTISSSWAQADTRFRTLFAARAELIEAGLVATYQRLTQVFGHDPQWLQQNADAFAAEIASAAEKLAPLPVTAARIRMLLDHDRLADLHRIGKPVQVLAASGDILTPPDLSRQIATAIAGAQFSLLAGAHFHPQANPEQFARQIQHFIEPIAVRI